MNFIVVGSGRTGAELAYRLYLKGHEVTVIDQRASEFGNLPPDFRGRTLEGDVLTRELLTRAGLEEGDGIAVVTSSDPVNALVGHLARDFGVPHVVIRNYNPRWLPLIKPFGLQVISSSIWAAQRMEELLDGTVRTIFSAGNGEVEVYEFLVSEAWHGRAMRDLVPTGGCVPVALTRAGTAHLATGDMAIEAGDALLVAASGEGAKLLQRRLASPGEEG